MLRRFSSSLASRYVMRSSQIPPRSLSLLPSPVQLAVSLTRALSAQASGGAKGEKPDDAGFNIFEQLKAQKKESGQSQFEEEPELNEKDKERLRWQQDKAEEALNARRFRLFRSGASITILGLGISYALLGMSSFKLVAAQSSIGSGLDFGSANEETDTSNSNFFERHHQRVKGALGGYYDVHCFFCLVSLSYNTRVFLSIGRIPPLPNSYPIRFRLLTVDL